MFQLSLAMSCRNYSSWKPVNSKKTWSFDSQKQRWMVDRIIVLTVTITSIGITFCQSTPKWFWFEYILLCMVYGNSMNAKQIYFVNKLFL